MKKWIGVRLCGWAAWLFGILAVSGVGFWETNGKPGSVAVIIVLFAVSSFMLAVVWFLGSLAAWAMRRHAETLIRQTGAGAGLVAAPAPDAWRCARCGAVNLAPPAGEPVSASASSGPRAVMTSPLAGLR